MNQTQIDESEIEKMILEYDYRCMKANKPNELASCLSAITLPFISPFIVNAIASYISPDKDLNASIALASAPISMLACLAYTPIAYALRQRKVEKVARRLKALPNEQVEKVLNKHSTLESECNDYEQDCNFLKKTQKTSENYSKEASQYFLERTNKYLDSVIRRLKLSSPSNQALDMILHTLTKNVNEFCNKFNQNWLWWDNRYKIKDLMTHVTQINNKYQELLSFKEKISNKESAEEQLVKQLANIIEEYNKPAPYNRWESTESKCH